MDFVDYVKLIRRRWQIPAVCLVLGAVIGFATTPEPPDPVVIEQGEYFRATHIMTVSSAPTADGASAPAVNLTQLAFETRVGDLPVAVADELGIPADALRGLISSQVLADVGAFALTAINEDPATAVLYADTFAKVMADRANEEAVESFNNRTAQVIARLDSLEADRDRLDTEIASATGSDRELLAAERDAIVNAYRLTYESFQQLANQEAPGPVLTTVESARPVAISQSQYSALFSGANELPGTAQPAPAAEDPSAATGDGVDTSPSVETSIGGRTRALLGAALGILFGIGLVVLLDRFDTRLRSKREVEEAYGLTVVAEVPPLSRARRKRAEVVVLTAPRSRIAEAYRALRTSILFVASAGIELRHGNAAREAARSGDLPTTPGPWLRSERGEALTIMVSSPGPEEGKTSTTANLAALMAEAGMQVLVINCDYRRPRIHKYLEEENDSLDHPLLNGVSIEADTGGPSFSAGGRAVQTIAPGVHLVTGIGESDAEANPAAVVAAQRKVVEVARRHFDIILLDTAPMLTTNDAVELLPEADLVVMTSRYGKTKRDKAELASELLERLGAPVVGVVFIESPDAPQAQYYYYYLDPAGGRRPRKRDDDAASDQGGASVTPLHDAG